MNLELMSGSVPMLLDGAVITLELFAWTMLLSAMLAIPLAIARVQPSTWLRWPIEGFCQVFRGTPMLVQLFVVYYGLAQLDAVRESWAWQYLRTPYWCAVVAFSLNTAAYTTHLLRGAIEAVPHGEVEAGRAFGFSTWTLYRKIILPRAMLLALPSYGNEVIKTIKRTSLASAITISDLTGVANTLVSRTFSPYEVFVPTAAIYLVFAYAASHAVRTLELRLSRHMRAAH